MKIKKFVAATMTQALTQIREELGPDAVILSASQVRAPGVMGVLAKARALEVTAAIDEILPETNGGVTPTAMPPASRILERITGEHVEPLRAEIARLRERIEKITTSIESQSSIREELAQIRAMLSFAETTPNVLTKQETTKTDALCERLRWHGVDAEIVKQLAHAVHLHNVDGKQPREIREIMAETMMALLPEPMPLLAPQEGKLVAALIGPTGAGKTTTLMKLAADLKLNQKREVGIINLDQFRIGAKEQITRYAELLGCRCINASSKEEFSAAIAELQACDAILIDTTGRAFSDRRHLSELGQMLSMATGAVKLLTLPAQVRETEIAQILKRFDVVGYDRLVITKLDEAVCFGLLANAALQSGKPLAHFTVGQQIPDDIEPATRERIVDCLLNISGDYAENEESEKEKRSKAVRTVRSLEMAI